MIINEYCQKTPLDSRESDTIMWRDTYWRL